MDLHLEGKTALILAASQGLGKAIATQLVKENVHVMLASRDEEKLKRVQEELLSLGGGKVYFHTTDITKLEEIKTLIQETKQVFGTVDILINNAGGPPGGGFKQFDDEAWQKAFELNLLSYIRTIREVLPLMEEKGGKIISIASSSIKQPIPSLVLSNTFRLGVVGLSKSLAEELAPSGILVNTVAPGRIATQRVAELDEMKAQRLGVTREKVEEDSKAAIPLKRYGEPEEFANVVTFLVSDANTYMTGSALLIDGGMVKSI